MDTKHYKRLEKQFSKRTKKLIDHLRKTSKDKSAFERCEHFCKHDYMVESDKHLIKRGIRPQAKYFNDANNICKKVHCNEKCEGFQFDNKKMETYFRNKIKKSFKKTYDPKTIAKLKERGALSGCSDIGAYDAFHN